MYGCVQPICCPPQYCVRDSYTPRMVPVIHPVVTINRQNIVDVPQHYVQQVNRNVVVNRGFVDNGAAGLGNGNGLFGRLFAR